MLVARQEAEEAALAVVFVAIERFGVRVPLRPFFAVTGSLLCFMAFVFAGRGVTELQEGSWIGVTPVRGLPSSDFLGIHPTIESLAAQGALVAALPVAIGWALVARSIRVRRRAAPAPAPRAARLAVQRRLAIRDAAWPSPGEPAARLRALPPDGDVVRPEPREHAAAD